MADRRMANKKKRVYRSAGVHYSKNTINKSANKSAGRSGASAVMITCPQCGAEYEAGLLRCPYCKSVDDYQDETEFMGDMEEIRGKVEDLPQDFEKETAKTARKETARDMHRIFRIVFGIIVGIVLLCVLAAFIDTKLMGSEEDQQEKRRAEYLWKEENYPLMDDLYAQQDWEGLLSFADEANSSALYDWEHYSVISGLRKIQDISAYYIKEADEAAEKDGADSQKAREARTRLFREEISIRFWEYQVKDPADAEIVKGQGAAVLQDLDERFALTEEETEQLRAIVARSGGILTTKECEDFLESRE